MPGAKKQDAGSDKGGFWEALARVLTHAESHGEVYEGARDDHAAIRAELENQTGDGSAGSSTDK